MGIVSAVFYGGLYFVSYSALADLILRRAEAGVVRAVEERVRRPAVDRHLDDVARRARNRRHDGQLRASQCVEQRTLACVRLSRDDHLDAARRKTRQRLHRLPADLLGVVQQRAIKVDGHHPDVACRSGTARRGRMGGRLLHE